MAAGRPKAPFFIVLVIPIDLILLFIRIVLFIACVLFFMLPVLSTKTVPISHWFSLFISYLILSSSTSATSNATKTTMTTMGRE